MKELHTTGDIVNLFGELFSTETVRQWTKDFSEFLSDNTRPPAGQTKLYNHDDIKVFAYIHEQRSTFNTSLEQIKNELAAGNRGEIPESPAVRVETELEKVIQERNELKMELDMLRVRMATAESLVKKYESRELEIQQRYEQRYEDKFTELNQEIGKLKAMIEILKDGKV